MQLENASPAYDDYDELVEFFNKINTDEARCEAAITNIKKYGSKTQQYKANVAFLYFKNTEGSSRKRARDRILDIQEDVRVDWANYLTIWGYDIKSAGQVKFT